MRIGRTFAIIGFAIPVAAFAFTPEATVSFNAFAWDVTGWLSNFNSGSYSGFPFIEANDSSLLGASYAGAGASLVNGSLFSTAGTGFDINSKPTYLTSASAALTDQVTFGSFSGTKQVTFGMYASSYAFSGNAEATEDVSDALAINNTFVAQQEVFSNGEFDGYSGLTTLSSWQQNLTYTVNVTSGETLTLLAGGGGGTFPVNSVGDRDAAGTAVFDPNWFLAVPTGVTYTTASGYQLPGGPNAVPEPSALLALGLPCVLFGLRRRSKSM